MGGSVSLSDAIYRNNGGGILAYGSVQLVGSTVTNNAGPISVQFGTLSIDNSTITANAGGVVVSQTPCCGPDTLITNSVIADNGAGIGEGYENVVRIGGCTIRGNASSGVIGGTDSGLWVYDSIVTDNATTGDGGGINASNCTGTRIWNTTISGNRAAGSGGGLYLRAECGAPDEIMVSNVTVADNTAGSGGGIAAFGNPYNRVDLGNSIIAGNWDAGGVASDCAASQLTSRGYNIIGDGRGCGMIGDETGNLIGVNPDLGPLQDNGGPTETYALLPGSPAIDGGNPSGCTDLWTGNPLTADQRGVPRPQFAACDIGAYEFACSNGVIDPGEQCDDGNLSNGDCCSSTCQFEPSTTVCRPAASECDVAESCTGTTGTCPADGFKSSGTPCTDDGNLCNADVCNGSGTCTHPALPDTDGDGICDAQDPCINIAGAHDFLDAPRPKLVVSKIGSDTTPGNDKLTLSGQFLLPLGASFSQLHPDTNGARIVIKNAARVTRLDVTLPAGAYAGAHGRGWKPNRKATTWTYADHTDSPVAGIVKMTIAAVGDPTSRQVSVKVTAKKGTYSVVPGDEPLSVTVVLGGPASSQAGECGERHFQAGDCGFNRTQNRLTCKK